MKSIYFNNLIEVLKKPTYFILFLAISFLFFLSFYYFTNYTLVEGNLGNNYLNTLIIIQIGISILFGLFISLTTYKFIYFSGLSFKQSFGSGIGGFIGLIGAGCASCSVTLATMLGLGGFIAFLPYHGLELSVLALLLLSISVFYSLKNLKVCKIKKSKKSN